VYHFVSQRESARLRAREGDGSVERTEEFVT
jgi:hypothetical protein